MGKAKYICCICEKPIDADETDGYTLNVKKFGGSSPEMVWAHGPCLRGVMPVIGADIPIAGPLP